MEKSFCDDTALIKAKKRMADIEDLSEVSVQLDDDDFEEEEERSESDEEDSRSESSREDEEEEDELFLDAQGRISLLQKLRERMQSSELFDDEDVSAVDEEIERIEENERNSLQTKMKERLRILTKYDRLLEMGTNHPKLNEYFVRKQQEMNELAREN